MEKKRSRTNVNVQLEEVKQQSSRKRDASAHKKVMNANNADGTGSAEHKGKAKEAFLNKKRKLTKEAPAPESSTEKNVVGINPAKPNNSRSTVDLQDSLSPLTTPS